MVISDKNKAKKNKAYKAEKNATPLYVGKKMLSPEVWEKKILPNQITHPRPRFPLKCQMVGPLVWNKPGIKPVENGPPEELTLEIIIQNSPRSMY